MANLPDILIMLHPSSVRGTPLYTSFLGTRKPSLPVWCLAGDLERPTQPSAVIDSYVYSWAIFTTVRW